MGVLEEFHQRGHAAHRIREPERQRHRGSGKPRFVLPGVTCHAGFHQRLADAGVRGVGDRLELPPAGPR